ncbi:MAG: LON peptidase substrate-binding domain-containing protein [Acidobacteria bacterium]|nr:LON peptidase substrate-binding domain-containing protein [Acidobacteriota bacterium]
MNRPARIPIFPLDVVLFPGIPLPLHIFEERYKLMVHECMEQRREFGVVMTRGDGVAAVGCTAAILQVAKQYPDGRMDILTVGRAPFQMNDVFDEKPYLEATVEYLEDEPMPKDPTSPHYFSDCFGIAARFGVQAGTARVAIRDGAPGKPARENGKMAAGTGAARPREAPRRRQRPWAALAACGAPDDPRDNCGTRHEN